MTSIKGNQARLFQCLMFIFAEVHIKQNQVEQEVSKLRINFRVRGVMLYSVAWR